MRGYSRTWPSKPHACMFFLHLLDWYYLHIPKCALKCLTNSIPFSCFFQNLTCPSWLAVTRKSVLYYKKKKSFFNSPVNLYWRQHASFSFAPQIRLSKYCTWMALRDHFLLFFSLALFMHLHFMCHAEVILANAHGVVTPIGTVQTPMTGSQSLG